MTKKGKPPSGGVWWEYGKAIGLALAAALIIRSSLVEANEIPTGSMLETIHLGDRVLVEKFAYDLRVPLLGWSALQTGRPARGDIVVFQPPVPSPYPYIKRIIGLPGDEISIIDKKIHLNSRELPEPYARFEDPEVLPLSAGPRDNFGPVIVPPGQYFLLGDNRDDSFDSRFWGFVSRDAIRGRAWRTIWSWDGARSGPRWDRLGALVK
ncbi:MAG: signal peptidase I [Pseudomonadota bacterium]